MTQQKSISSKSHFLSHSLFYIIILIELITPLISIIRLFVKCGAWKKGCIKFGGLINLHNKLIKPWRIKERKRINSVVLSMKLEESASVHLV